MDCRMVWEIDCFLADWFEDREVPMEDRERGELSESLAAYLYELGFVGD